jgi:hypothetical protein
VMAMTGLPRLEGEISLDIESYGTMSQCSWSHSICCSKRRGVADAILFDGWTEW